jgi:hypothetical protein
MTKTNITLASRPVCNTLAIVIYGIEYGIDDYVKVKYAGIGYELETRQRLETRKIHYDDNGAWFTFHGNKEYISEYMKVEAQQ